MLWFEGNVGQVVFRASTEFRALVVSHKGSPQDGAAEAMLGDEFGLTTFDTLILDLQCNPSVDVVLSPLFGQSFDILDVAHILEQVDFSGRLRGLSPPLPKPQLIRDEVAARFPELDFDILVSRRNATIVPLA
ncbi:MAG: hypothetical protein AAF667_03550 [Pseudomonadota bacterium]